MEIFCKFFIKRVDIKHMINDKTNRNFSSAFMDRVDKKIYFYVKCHIPLMKEETFKLPKTMRFK